ncbi:hypothetical protein EV182_002061 [Spiromyces aspiralis]|uniref:Uncharacterized protein n=1 Tax=Spiromyces aspiralis TaxID=68401 RepID=A0ACC1HVS9_9FUNG|nr:hypothetical protein EV182_002061 [Spiromyces aspiralis]
MADSEQDDDGHPTSESPTLSLSEIHHNDVQISFELGHEVERAWNAAWSRVEPWNIFSNNSPSPTSAGMPSRQPSLDCANVMASIGSRATQPNVGEQPLSPSEFVPSEHDSDDDLNLQKKMWLSAHIGNHNRNRSRREVVPGKAGGLAQRRRVPIPAPLTILSAHRSHCPEQHPAALTDATESLRHPQMSGTLPSDSNCQAHPPTTATSTISVTTTRMCDDSERGFLTYRRECPALPTRSPMRIRLAQNSMTSLSSSASTFVPPLQYLGSQRPSIPLRSIISPPAAQQNFPLTNKDGTANRSDSTRRQSSCQSERGSAADISAVIASQNKHTHLKNRRSLTLSTVGSSTIGSAAGRTDGYEHAQKLESIHLQVKKLVKELSCHYATPAPFHRQQAHGCGDVSGGSSPSNHPHNELFHTSCRQIDLGLKLKFIDQDTPSLSSSDEEYYAAHHISSSNQSLELQLKAAEAKINSMEGYIESLTAIIDSMDSKQKQLICSLDRSNSQKKQLARAVQSLCMRQYRHSSPKRKVAATSSSEDKRRKHATASRSLLGSSGPMGQEATPLSSSLGPSKLRSSGPRRPLSISAPKLSMLESLRSVHAANGALDLLIQAQEDGNVLAAAASIVSGYKPRTIQEWTERSRKRVDGLFQDWSQFQTKWDQWTRRVATRRSSETLMLEGPYYHHHHHLLAALYCMLSSQIKAAGYALRSAHQLLDCAAPPASLLLSRLDRTPDTTVRAAFRGLVIDVLASFV